MLVGDYILNFFDLLTYLEYINMYKRLVTIKATELDQQIARLQTGNLIFLIFQGTKKLD
jgi:hypothetical protein